MTTSVLVIGGGPAGLAAGTRLLESGADLSVRLITMGHHLGGKAASYRSPEGHLVEHGWHMVLGFYHNMRGLMRRAGIDVERTLTSMGGEMHPYEPSTGVLSTVSSGGSRLAVALQFVDYEAIPLGDRLNYGRFMAGAYAAALSGQDLRRHDDICFRTWAIERGLRPHVTRYSLFRFFREAYFNFPESMSAYHMLQTLKLMSTPEDAEAFVIAGGSSEQVWDPIGGYFRDLGGRIDEYTMATDWRYDGRRITGVVVGRPDSSGHADGAERWSTTTIPTVPDSRRVIEDVDYVISTIPHAVLVTMNGDDERMWRSPYFSRLLNLRSASTVSMTIVTDRPVVERPGPVFGLPAPLGICVNMTPYWPEYRDDPSVGAVLAFVGQEAGFEDWSDDEIAAFTLDNVARVPELGDIRRAGLRWLEFHRNRSDFERLLLCEPGVQPFRPGPLTPFDNLVLAGDWVANPIDLICMEGAVSSGLIAAETVLRKAGLAR